VSNKIINSKERCTTFTDLILATERAGAEVVECACVIELPDLKVSRFFQSFY
jgi:adenine/guanine phosphoribosyltransferase-like PRPP-binding protein